jgi:hypothetical protein
VSAAPGAGEQAALVAAATVQPAARRRSTLVIGALLAAALVAAEGVQAWAELRREQNGPLPAALAAGTLCSVMLVNGQIYYGELRDVDARFVRLQNVYYVQVTAAAPGAPPNNRLVSRRRADWHAPTVMAIPVDKVLMIEAVGSTSRLAELIKQDGAAGANP